MYRIVKMFRDFCFSYAPRYRRAGVAMVVGIASPILIGATGFAVDASFWVSQHTALQTATDAGAVKAARDLASNPATTLANLASDALTAANQSMVGQVNLTSSEITVTQLTDTRQVKVSATIPANRFFSQVVYPGVVNISTTSVAGVAYPLISTQATCYAADSYTYLYSTGFGTIDTAHSSGLDPYGCGTPPTPPAVYDSYCGGGVLGCSLDLLQAGNLLLPFAFQVGPTGGSGGLNVVLAPVVNTLVALLGGASASGPGSMTFVGPGSSYCSGSVCTIPGGVYNGGLTIESGVTANFGAGYFLIENGNFVISTQATVPANTAVFYLGGANPGAMVEQTQIQVNTAPLNAGSILLTSASTFKSSSLIGTQTSSPLSSAPYAQQQALGQGLLSALGLPGQNLVGTNFESAISVCTDATSTCASPLNQQAIFQSTLIPSLAVVQQILPQLTAADLLANEGETSTTTITSGVTYANGVPTDWSQSETASSTLTNTLETIPAVLNSLGVPLLSLVVTPVLQPILNAIAPSVSNSQSTTASGVFAGQTSTGAPSCATQPQLYYQKITPAFSPGFSDILQLAGENGATGSMSLTDTITICGTTPSGITSINPIGVGTKIVSSTASGSSAIYLLQ